MQFIFIILSLFLKSFLAEIDVRLFFCCKSLETEKIEKNPQVCLKNQGRNKFV